MSRVAIYRKTTETGSFVHVRGHSRLDSRSLVESVQNTNVVGNVYVVVQSQYQTSKLLSTLDLARHFFLKQCALRRDSPVASLSVPLSRFSDFLSEAHVPCGS
jgi:hypothetical protein